MNIIVNSVYNINEDALIDYLHSEYSTLSKDDMMDLIAEDDSIIINWVISHTPTTFDDIDEYSYEEIIEYIENNF